MPRRIGLVLLDYDQAPITQRCLRSVAAGSRRPDEIVLVENGEAPVDLESDEALAGLRVRVLRLGRNLGAAGGRNLGVERLLEKGVGRVVLLDNDTTVPGDFFELVAEASLGGGEVAAPLVLDMDSGEVIYAGGNYDRHHVPGVIAAWPARETGPKEVDWAPTAALVFDREAWLRVGPFDAWYEFLWEDVEWCHRARRRGMVVRVRPRLRVLHEAHQSSGGAFSAERVRHWSRNGTVFLFTTARIGWRSRLSWLGTELGRVVRELRAGWRPTAMGRLRGLAQG
ncbi:MAG: glycosyltransferase family 2 protein, partial [Solirubrobacterales bacterium]